MNDFKFRRLLDRAELDRDELDRDELDRDEFHTVLRSMENFNQTTWSNCLLTKNWECLGETENVNDMAIALSKMVNKALDVKASFWGLFRNLNLKCMTER